MFQILYAAKFEPNTSNVKLIVFDVLQLSKLKFSELGQWRNK